MAGNITGVQLGFLIGAIPTISMTVASAVLTSISVTTLVEAAFQNFAAGLIIAAVAGELFPLMIGSSVSPTESMIGITVGFTVGLIMLHGVEAGIEYCIKLFDKRSQVSDTLSNAISATNNAIDSHRKKTDIPFDDVEGELTLELANLYPRRDSFVRRDSLGDEKAFSLEDVLGEWEEAPLVKASLAIATPNHRQHLEEHLIELKDYVLLMESKAGDDGPVPLLDRLLAEGILAEGVGEQLAEEIDEAIHCLQYKLDHCKRLLQGSETQAILASGGTVDQSILEINFWVTDAKKIQIKGRLGGLKSTIQHLVEHIQEENIDRDSLKEMHEHMEHMDAQLSSFHSSVEKASSKWRRSRPTTMPEPRLGDTIPVSLVVPVAMDCFIDGFLIGVTCALSPKAGIVLGAANCLEMAFLGMAFATRIAKCTGSSANVRAFTLYVPPLLMFMASGFGAYLAEASQGVPAVYVAFVAFGVVSLLALVCNELLIEAKEAQGDDEKWWINVLIFAGIYLVLMLSRVM